MTSGSGESYLFGLPVDQDSRAVLASLIDNLFVGPEFLGLPISSDSSMEHFVGPIMILTEGRERVTRLSCDFPFITFPGFRHQTLLDEIQDRMPLSRRELGAYPWFLG